MADFGELKQRHRAMWASGEYDAVAAGIRPVADHVVRAAGIRAGERVLDVACGTGNTALMARARGAHVTGVDLTPELLAVARRRPPPAPGRPAAHPAAVRGAGRPRALVRSRAGAGPCGRAVGRRPAADERRRVDGRRRDRRARHRPHLAHAGDAPLRARRGRGLDAAPAHAARGRPQRGALPRAVAHPDGLRPGGIVVVRRVLELLAGESPQHL